MPNLHNHPRGGASKGGRVREEERVRGERNRGERTKEDKVWQQKR